jgi:hypothetical protein
MGMKVYRKISNDNGVRVVNFATSKNLTVKSTMFAHRNIHKYMWMSPDEKPQNQIDNILAADGDTYHYLVVAKFMERLAMNEQRSQRFHTGNFKLKTINKVETKDKYHVEVSYKFEASRDLEAEMEINSAWKMIRQNIKISTKEVLG